MEDSEIKLEGRRGLIYAENENGDLINAKDADNKSSYYCPFCKIQMHPSHHGASYYFAKMAKTTHKEKVCEQIEKTGRYMSFKGLTPDDFINSLCHSPKELEKNNSELKDKVIPSQKSTIKPDDSAFVEETAFKKLKDIYDYNISEHSSDESFDGHKISDFVLFYKWVDLFFDSKNQLRDINPRIIQARFAWADYKNDILVFSVFSQKRNINFLLFAKVTTSSNFKQLRDKFEKRTFDEATSKPKYEKIHNSQDVFIAANNWELLDQKQIARFYPDIKKFYEKNIGAYYCTLGNNKQLFLFPTID